MIPRQSATPSAWSRATPRLRAAFIAIFAAEVGAIIVLVSLFGIGRGLAYFLLALLPFALLAVSLPIWWSIRGKTFDPPK